MQSIPLTSTAGQAGNQVSHGLNLTLELAHPVEMPVLLAKLKLGLDKTHAALNELHFVHFARFLPARGNTALLVITEFDGPLQAYVLDFVIAIGDVFSMILSYVKDAPPLPVQNHPREFLAFVARNNRVIVLPPLIEWADFPVYSAYPAKTVIDIVGMRSGLPVPFVDPTPVPIDLADVQGNILQGYRADRGHHYALHIRDPRSARAFLDAVTNGDATACPQVSVAAKWEGPRPSTYLNVGLTAAGLATLGLPPATLDLFPEAFVQGPAAHARAVASGDVGPSAPEHWRLGGPGPAVHMLVSLYARNDEASAFEMRHQQLLTCWGDGVDVLRIDEVRQLPRAEVHFGYRDSIAQPGIAGIDNGKEQPDLQPDASAGQFLLGASYPTIYGGSSLGSLPAALCQNATYAAVRVMDQDCEAFELAIAKAAETHQVDKEWIAAKLMGRWRNGAPLSLHPDPVGGAMPPLGKLPMHNHFDYGPTVLGPQVENDHAGLRCPVGAHIRRMNPRSALVAGSPYSRRLMRRGMPYGRQWPDGGADARRGLYGIFLCSDLERQYEFLLQVWANGDSAASGIRGTQDPIIGAQSMGGNFRIPTANDGALALTCPRLTTTAGSLYLLMPGIGGLRYLAGMACDAGGRVTPSTPSSAATTNSFKPERFDPKDPGFLADPYPFYAQFRKHAPVALVRHANYASYWVFSHELVTEVCDATQDYLKRPVGDTSARGLFFMDPPRHTEIRGMLDPLFDKAIVGVRANASIFAKEAIADIIASGTHLDFIPAYANRVSRNVFMAMFGIPPHAWGRVGGWVDTILTHFDQMLPPLKRAPALLKSMEVMGYLALKAMACPAHGQSSELLCQMRDQGKSAGLSESELAQTALHFALGGYLSTEFLIGTGVRTLLLENGTHLAQYRSSDQAAKLTAIEEMKRFDAPFQMADRYAARALRLGGCDIPKDAMVTVVYGSANHDERVFKDAERFMMHRTIPAGTNYVFGRGIHHCIGAPMVANLVPAAFDELFDAFPDLALTEAPFSRYPDPYYRAFSKLELRWR